MSPKSLNPEGVKEESVWENLLFLKGENNQEANTGITHWPVQHRIKDRHRSCVLWAQPDKSQHRYTGLQQLGNLFKYIAYPCRRCDPGKNPLHSPAGTGPGAMPEERNRRCSEWPEVPRMWSMNHDKLVKKQSTQNWNIPFFLLESGVADYSLL